MFWIIFLDESLFSSIFLYESLFSLSFNISDTFFKLFLIQLQIRSCYMQTNLKQNYFKDGILFLSPSWKTGHLKWNISRKKDISRQGHEFIGTARRSHSKCRPWGPACRQSCGTEWLGWKCERACRGEFRLRNDHRWALRRALLCHRAG